MRTNIFIFFIFIVCLFYSCDKKEKVVEYFANGKPKHTVFYLSPDSSSYRETYFYDNGKKWGESVYRNGNLNMERLYFENGNLKTSGVIYWMDTVPYYDTLDNGAINGIVMFAGNVTDWYENGKIKTQQIFLKGDTSYIFKNWNEEGDFISEEHQKKGRVISKKTYTQND